MNRKDKDRRKIRTQTGSPLRGLLPPSELVLLLQHLYHVSDLTTALKLGTLTASAIVVWVLPKIVNMVTIHTRWM